LRACGASAGKLSLEREGRALENFLDQAKSPSAASSGRRRGAKEVPAMTGRAVTPIL